MCFYQCYNHDYTKWRKNVLLYTSFAINGILDKIIQDPGWTTALTVSDFTGTTF